MAEQKLKPLHLACLDDEMRPNYNLIRINNNIATATNGTILVKLDLTMVSSLLPEELEIINGKYIHAEVWKEIHKCDQIEFLEDEIVCHNNDIKKRFDYSQPTGELWDSNSIVQDIKEAGEMSKRIAQFNTKMIQIVAKIFDADTLYFSFTKGNKKGTVVFPYEDSGMFAIIMPVELRDGVNRYFFMD